jgi:hypothetical protein
MSRQEVFISIILSAIGLIVWIAIGKMSNEVEAWDSIQYYKIGLPIIFGASATAGFIEPKRPWRWGIFVFVLQPVALLIQSGEVSLVLVGIFFFFIFIAVAIGFAYIGSMLRKYTSK